jgi:hypothetical protein
LKSHKTPPFATEDTCLQAMLGKPQLQKTAFGRQQKSNVSVGKKKAETVSGKKNA